MLEHGRVLDIVTCIGVIDGLCNDKCVDEELELLSRLRSYGCKPDSITYTTVLKGLCSFETVGGCRIPFGRDVQQQLSS
jgi:pentatricopeptide repeat protein